MLVQFEPRRYGQGCGSLAGAGWCGGVPRKYGGLAQTMAANSSMAMMMAACFI